MAEFKKSSKKFDDLPQREQEATYNALLYIREIFESCDYLQTLFKISIDNIDKIINKVKEGDNKSPK